MKFLRLLISQLPFRHSARRFFRRFRNPLAKGRKGRKIIALLFIGLIAAHFLAPPQHVPWKPLDVNGPIGMATGIKLNFIALGPDRACRDKLSQASHLRHEIATPVSKGKCGYEHAVSMISRAEIKFSPSAQVTATCPIVLSSYIWLARVDELARYYFDSPLAKVHHAGTYSCRRQIGNRSGQWSEHAFANAWDITGFELKNGTVISVFKHWPKSLNDQFFGRDPKAKFLAAARDAACRVFRVVLSPDYNAAHQDHFHLDHGSNTSCS